MTLTWWIGRAAALGVAVLTLFGGVTTAAAQTEFIELLKKQGMQVTEVDTAAFRSKAAPVYKEFEARIGKELLDEVLRSK